MAIRWGVLSAKSKKPLNIAWMITAGLLAFYVGSVLPRERDHSVAQSKGTGLASVAGGDWEPISLWRQASILPNRAARETFHPNGTIGGVPGSMVRTKSVAYLTAPAADSADEDEDRKLIRNASLSLLVKSPAESAEIVIHLAQSVGGFLVNSQLNGGSDATSASLNIRVPAAKFEDVRQRIRKLGLRVEGESVEAQDVTKQYVDQEARLRNLRAQEQQYLGILRKAKTLKDTLEVSDKLNEVRGAIEERQAEFEALSKQIETVAISVTLRAESDAQVFGLHWRPLYQLKIAAREGLEGFGDYAASMTMFVFFLPTILLWLFTILVGAAIAWRILRWAVRILFPSPKPNIRATADAQ